MKKLFIIFITVAMIPELGISQSRIHNIEFGLGHSRITNFFSQNVRFAKEFGPDDDFPINKTNGINFNVGITIFKRFKLRYNYSYLSRSHNESFSNTGTYQKYDEDAQQLANLDPFGNSYVGPKYYYYGEDTYVFKEFQFLFCLNPFKSTTFHLGFKIGQSGVYLFDEKSPFEKKIDALEGDDGESNYVEANLGHFIPTQDYTSNYFAPNLLVKQKLNNFLSIEFGMDFKYYQKQLYIYEISDLIIENDYYDEIANANTQTILKFDSYQFPFFKFNFSTSLIFNIGSI